jgi:DNA-binding NarL/FixJ family response regulator
LSATDGHSVLAHVFIAGPTRLYCEGLACLLSPQAGIEVVGTGSDAGEIIASVARLEPDVVLLDPTLPDGMQTIRELALGLEVRVIALGCRENDVDMIACAEAGVSGFLTPEASVADLVASIQGAGEGELHCSPKLAGALLRRVTALASGRPLDGPASSLTMRELQVVRLIDRGLSNKQIALELEIELSTVKHHVHHILEKLEVARRGEAVARLRQQGLLQR